ncbi:YihY family inner membrane protein [Xanthomonas sp. Kuri4-1]
MAHTYSMTLLKERLHDRARAVSFGRFLWERFLDDRLFQASASLAYTTVFALVPLAIVVFGVLSAFPAFEEWKGALTDFIFNNFVPGAARSVQNYLNRSLEDLGKFTVAGMVALVASLLITLHSIEQTFNNIWRVASARPKFARFLIYWTVLTLGTMLAAASMAMAAYVFALPLFASSEGQWLAGMAWRLAPMGVEFLCIVLIYCVVPQHTVRLRHALPGALLAVTLLEVVKWGLGIYLGNFQTYQRIYGALSALPILLLWIYLSWVAVLLGASLSSSIAAFRYQPASMRLPQGYEIYGLLRLLGRFRQARAEGKGLDEDRILALEPMLTDNLVQQLLCELARIRLVRRDERGEWLLARDLDGVPLSELYESCQLRVPIAEKHLPCRDDALGKAVSEALNELRLPMRGVLKRPVGDIYRHLPGESA